MQKPLAGKTVILAHRGASAYYPENTIPAFKAAIELKSDGIELDIHMSADGEIVVIHDGTLERVTNNKATDLVAKKTFKELSEYDVSYIFAEKMADVRIPTLREVYELYANLDFIINVEMKSGCFGAAEQIIALEREFPLDGKIIYSSFDHIALTKIKEVSPSAVVAPLYSFGMVAPWDYAAGMGAQAIHPHHSQIFRLPEYIAECHKRGICVNTWTVDDPTRAVELAKMGVDAIITNKPDVIRTALENIE